MNTLVSICLNCIRFIKYKLTNETIFCHIEEIDLTKRTIVIHCKGINAQIKFTLDEIISDPVILTNLSPTQASLIGYYYGKYYTELIKDNNRYIMNFSIDESPNKFNIIMLNRNGNLIYSNHENNTHTISPINAMRCINIITQFDSTQACYIGILAGINAHKKAIKAHHPRLNSGETHESE